LNNYIIILYSIIILIMEETKQESNPIISVYKVIPDNNDNVYLINPIKLTCIIAIVMLILYTMNKYFDNKIK